MSYYTTFYRPNSLLNPTKTSSSFSDELQQQFYGFSSKSIACAVREDENRGNAEHVMDQRGVSANYQTYLWLLEGFLSYGSLLDVSMLHGRIMKLGFIVEEVLLDRLFDVYIRLGDISGAVKVLDEMSGRDASGWNEIISVFLRRKMYGSVLEVFMRMVSGNVSPDENTFAGVLRAWGGGIVDLGCVRQIHGRLICSGYGSCLVVCNPLIDVYSKTGLVGGAEKVFDSLSVKDSVSWVAMVSGLSRNGCEEEAVNLFCKMHVSNIFPTPYVFSSVLSACAKKELFDAGEQLHGLVFKFGFSSQTFVCNALLSLYTRGEDFMSAEQIFSNMQLRDAVSYNSLISGLAQRGYSGKALELFEKMQLDGLKPDCVTVASLLSACASTGALHKGTQLHSYAIKAGMISDIIIEGALLDLYVKCSDIDTAHQYFLTTNRENVVLWNVMLVAYGQLDNLDESFRVFKEMNIKGMIPNQFTYPSILRTCTSVGALALGQQINAHVIKTGFQFNVYVCSVLIDMYAKHGRLDVACKILRRLPEKDVVSWTAMIAGYAQHDMFSEALELFQEMQNHGIQSDNIGFASAISACAGLQALKQGQQIHAQSVIFGYSDDQSIGNALVSLYARCGRIKEAYLAFAKIEIKDSISWNSLISGYAQSGMSKESLLVFSDMNRAGVKANLFTFGSAVSAAANIANVKQGKQIHAMIIKTGYEAEMEASNVLITLYAKCGNLSDAKKEFIEMPIKNDISWNAIITGYSQHGYGREALHLFEEMKKSGVMPNHTTFVGVLSACSHVGLVNEGLKYFESMSKEYGLLPKPEHYNCVVDLLSRRGLLSRAKEFIKSMPIKPDAMAWRTLLSACIVHKKSDIGEFAARHLLELEPDDSASYVLLSNMYAVAGKWECRNQTRQMMKDRGVKKEPGRSWVEIRNKIHAFYAGDKLHPLSKEIYEYLEDLNQRAAEIGYIQDRFSLLNDAEQKQDLSMYVHSEKLAIAFALLTLPDSVPLHVFKNLRVCNDCHNWIKFVSKMSNRSIVVRDAYRFHHFEGGFCSCRDYW